MEFLQKSPHRKHRSRERERERERERNYFRVYGSESNSIPIPKSMEKRERNAYGVRFNLIGLNFIGEEIQHVQVMILDLSGSFNIMHKS